MRSIRLIALALAVGALFALGADASSAKQTPADPPDTFVTYWDTL